MFLLTKSKNLWRVTTPLATPLQIFKKFDYPFKNPRSAPVSKLISTVTAKDLIIMSGQFQCLAKFLLKHEKQNPSLQLKRSYQK